MSTMQIHDALKAANLEYAALSWNGFDLFGERKSIQEAKRLLHNSDSRLPVIQDRLLDLVNVQTKTCLDETGINIKNELYKAVSALTGDPCLLAMIGSWADTLDDEDILSGLQRYNEMGECFVPDVVVRNDDNV